MCDYFLTDACALCTLSIRYTNTNSFQLNGQTEDKTENEQFLLEELYTKF